VRPHKVIVPEPEPAPAARTPPSFIPKGWSWHPEDQITRLPMPPFNPSKMGLYFSPFQTGNGRTAGQPLRPDLEGQFVLGSDDLDNLLANQGTIPDTWKGQEVSFCGDVYRGTNNGLYVRYLFWSDERKVWDDYWLDYSWGSRHTVAVVAS